MIIPPAQSKGEKAMKVHGFGSVIWVVFAIAACSTIAWTLTVRLLFRRSKAPTDL
jgi:hypothetical protein